MQRAILLTPLRAVARAETSLGARVTCSTVAFCSDQVVCAAARGGFNSGQLMRMRWVLTIKDDDTVKARLVVQGFTDPDLVQIPTSSPTCSRRARQIFLSFSACSLYYLAHTRHRAASAFGRRAVGSSILRSSEQEAGLEHAMAIMFNILSVDQNIKL